jgi:hypothetical protein
MSFTILPPRRAFPAASAASDIDSDGDTAMDTTSATLGALVTPGELVTDDPQWMRSRPPPHPPTHH